jgi:hypothetical protein
LQERHCVHEAVNTALRRANGLPLRQEPAKCSLVYRLYFLAQSRKRPATKRPKNIGFAPLTFGTVRLELASHQTSSRLKRHQRARRPLVGDTESLRHRLCDERGVSSRKTRHHVIERMSGGFGECHR